MPGPDRHKEGGEVSTPRVRRLRRLYRQRRLQQQLRSDGSIVNVY